MGLELMMVLYTSVLSPKLIGPTLNLEKFGKDEVVYFWNLFVAGYGYTFNGFCFITK